MISASHEGIRGCKSSPVVDTLLLGQFTGTGNSVVRHGIGGLFEELLGSASKGFGVVAKEVVCGLSRQQALFGVRRTPFLNDPRFGVEGAL